MHGGTPTNTRNTFVQSRDELDQHFAMGSRRTCRKNEIALTVQLESDLWVILSSTGTPCAAFALCFHLQGISTRYFYNTIFLHCSVVHASIDHLTQRPRREERARSEGYHGAP